MMAIQGLMRVGVNPHEVGNVLTHEHVRASAVDFADMIERDEDVRAELGRIGILDRVERGLESAERAYGKKPKALAGRVEGIDPGVVERIAKRAARHAPGFRGQVGAFDDAVEAVKASRREAAAGEPVEWLSSWGK